MRSEIYKDHYEFEWEHRSYLSRSLNVPIAVSTIIGSAAAVMIQKFPYQAGFFSYFFIVLVAVSVLSIALAAFFLFKAFVGYECARVPTPLTLKSHYDELNAWHKKYGDGESAAEKKFEESFDIRLGEATEKNAANNKRKSGYLYRCNAALALSLLFLAFSAVPYIYTNINHQDKTYNVRLVSDKAKYPSRGQEMNIPEEDEPTKDEDRPAEPTMPPNENIKEHNVRPETNRPSDKEDD